MLLILRLVLWRRGRCLLQLLLPPLQLLLRINQRRCVALLRQLLHLLILLLLLPLLLLGQVDEVPLQPMLRQHCLCRLLLLPKQRGLALLQQHVAALLLPLHVSVLMIFHCSVCLALLLLLLLQVNKVPLQLVIRKHRLRRLLLLPNQRSLVLLQQRAAALSLQLRVSVLRPGSRCLCLCLALLLQSSEDGCVGAGLGSGQHGSNASW